MGGWGVGRGLRRGGSPLGLDEGRRGEEAAEELADRGDCDEGQLDAEANDDAEHERHDKVLEDAQAAHRTRRPVEDEDDEHVGDGDCAAGDEGELEEEVERYGSADDLARRGG